MCVCVYLYMCVTTCPKYISGGVPKYTIIYTYANTTQLHASGVIV